MFLDIKLFVLNESAVKTVQCCPLKILIYNFRYCSLLRYSLTLKVQCKQIDIMETARDSV